MANAGDTVRASDDTRYYCRTTQSTAQTGLADGTYVAIQFNGTDDVDSLTMHDPVTNNTRFVIGLKLGWWQVFGTIAWTGGLASKEYRAKVTKNGTTDAPGSLMVNHTGTTGGVSSQTFATVQATASTDYVEIYGYFTTGTTGSTSVGTSSYRSAASLFYLGA